MGKPGSRLFAGPLRSGTAEEAALAPSPRAGGQARPFAQADDRWLAFMQPDSGVWRLEQCGGTKQ